MPACGAPRRVGPSRSRHPVLGVTAVTRKSPALSPLPRNTPTHGSRRGGGFAPTSGRRVLGAPRTRMLLPWQRVCSAPSPPGTPPGWLRPDPAYTSFVPRLHGTRPRPRQGGSAASAIGKLPLEHRRRQELAGTYVAGGEAAVRGDAGAVGTLRQRGGWQGHHPSPRRAVPVLRLGNGCCSGGTAQGGPRCQRTSGCQRG